MQNNIKYTLLKLLPKRGLTYLTGILANCELPKELLQSFIKFYSKKYKVDLTESKLSLEFFATFNEFFTRELVSSCRPVNEELNSMVSPADAQIAQFGEIQEKNIMQAKGICYSLTDLIGQTKSEVYRRGHFITLYLSPGSYHGIHAPYKGEISEVTYFPGTFWPVNEFGVTSVGALFAINERICSFMKIHKNLECGIVKVGALIVGKINLRYTQVNQKKYRGNVLNIKLNQPVSMQKGERMGQFEVGGSTVILLFKKGMIQFSDRISIGMKIKYGEKLGIIPIQMLREE